MRIDQPNMFKCNVCMIRDCTKIHPKKFSDTRKCTFFKPEINFKKSIFLHLFSKNDQIQEVHKLLKAFNLKIAELTYAPYFKLYSTKK